VIVDVQELDRPNGQPPVSHPKVELLDSGDPHGTEDGNSKEVSIKKESL
jgi:hypothetical protein